VGNVADAVHVHRAEKDLFSWRGRHAVTTGQDWRPTWKPCNVGAKRPPAYAEFEHAYALAAYATVLRIFNRYPPTKSALEEAINGHVLVNGVEVANLNALALRG
jgi:hypothetical protein